VDLRECLKVELTGLPQEHTLLVPLLIIHRDGHRIREPFAGSGRAGDEWYARFDERVLPEPIASRFEHLRSQKSRLSVRTTEDFQMTHNNLQTKGQEKATQLNRVAVNSPLKTEGVLISASKIIGHSCVQIVIFCNYIKQYLDS